MNTIENIKIVAINSANAEIKKICTQCKTEFWLGEDLTSTKYELIVVSPCKCYQCEEEEV